MKIFFSAGEASGDALGAHLIDALRRRVPDLEAYGMGGREMERAGLFAVRQASELNVVGLFEVLKHLPRLYRLLWDLAAKAIDGRPDVAVLIDVPDFNIRLARYLTRARVPVVFYVGPSVWAWRSGRIARWKREVARLLVLFPFETEVWRSAGVDVSCVGHPLLDEIPSLRDPAKVDARTIALLPGSRPSEIHRLFPVMLDAAALLVDRGRAERFVLPLAPTLDEQLVRSMIAKHGAQIADRIEIVRSSAGDPAPKRNAIAKAAIALVASGTATLETALLGTPQVIVYRFSRLTWWIGRRLARIRYLGLPNLIAGREIARELLQESLHPVALAEAAEALLAAPNAQIAALAELRAGLGPSGAAERAADAVLEVVRACEERTVGATLTKVR